MEVHHHSHKPKNWKEYITEFIMLFAAITLGFLAENLREHQIMEHRVEQNKIAILKDLNNLMKGENKPFLNEKISMAEIAKILEVSTQQISQVVNEKTGLNFNDYVNTFRIEEAKMILLSSSFSKLTIDAIAQKSGFGSKSAFYAAFKKHNGNTPKEFIASEERTAIQLEK